ncbi:hypothetical protein Ato02nite_044290 [Paractinoplanes toevensis]|uniref:Uncharacterized protein n=2 Tax=Paractinoplanes toevensis TaxID=571911 RepID=A0A919TEK1_9ACTN|nr:hypothetical protein Ato02nite_044290 [Actinoplanes toevensis]
MEEVAEMEIYTMTQPSLPLTRACAPSALLPTAAASVAAMSAPPVAPVALVAERAWIPAEIVRPMAILAAERAPVSRVHQVQAQAELAQVLTLTDGINGTNGTTGFKGSSVSMKRYADGGSGVPPRGRPV